MVKWIENKRLSSFIFSGMFSVLLFFLLLSLLSDVLDDYTGIVITKEVTSVANFLLLIYSISIMAIVIASNVLSDVDLPVSMLAGLFAFLLTTVLMTIISVVSLQVYYPQLFIREGREISWYEIVLNFSVLNTKYALYILGSATTYFFMILAMMTGVSFIFVNIMKGYEKE